MKKKYADDQEKIIVEMYNLGKSTVEIATLFNDNASTIASIVKRHIGSLRSNKDNSRKYQYDMNFFNHIDTEAKAYWLGFIYADAYVQLRKDKGKLFGLTLSIADINHLEKFKADIKAEHPIRIYKASKTGYSNNDYCRIIISGEEIYNNLVRHGVVPNKTLTLTAPNLTTMLIKHFIRGYIDGDGCITSSKNEYAVKIVGTENILDYIKDYIQSNHIATIKNYYKRRPTDTVMNIDLRENYQIKNFLDLLYKNANIYLDRKYNKYKDLCNLLHSRAQ